MKKTLTIFAIIFLGLYTYLHGEIIENIEVEQRNDGTCLVDIYFDLIGHETALYNVTIEVSFDGGATYAEVPGQYLSGSIEDVSPATGLHIEWAGLASHPGIYTEEAKVKIIASRDFLFCGDDITFVYRGEEVTYGTVENPETGKCWMDRNLGALRAATASDDDEAYGDLFQWGRLDDEHQDRASSTTYKLSSMDDPGHDDFIVAPDSPNDWRSPQNPDLWQGDGGINDPCPPGWRIPTETEFNNERLDWDSNNTAGAFASPLKLTAAGSRSSSNGLIYVVGSSGYYWSSNVISIYSRILYFESTNATTSASNRANGASVRCIKDE